MLNDRDGNLGRIQFSVLLVSLCVFGVNIEAAEVKTYNTSVEVAQAAAAVDNLIETGNRLLEFEDIQARILAGPCSNDWEDYVSSGQKILMLDAQEKRNGYLTAEENTLASRQQQLRRTSKTAFDRCFAQQAQNYATLRQYNASSNKLLAQAYVKVVADYADQMRSFASGYNSHLEAFQKANSRLPTESTPSDEIRRILDSLERQKQALLSKYDRVIAKVASVLGAAAYGGAKLEVQRRGQWILVKKDDELRIGEVVRTGPGTRARLLLLDRLRASNWYEGSKQAGPTIINMAPDTELELLEQLVRTTGFYKGTIRNTLLSLLKGTISAFTKNWGSGSSFSVRTGTSLCGIRGTEVAVKYDPQNEEVIYRVVSGVVEITAGDGKKFDLQPLETVTLLNGIPGPIRLMGANTNSAPPT